MRVDARLRVRMVAQRFPPRARTGSERQALLLARALIGLGVDVDVATTRFEPGLPAREVVDGVEVRRRSTAPAALRKPSQLVAGARAGASARGVDVVHGHALSSTVLGAVVGAATAGVPSLVKQSLGGSSGDLATLRRSAAAPVLLRALRLADGFAVLDDAIERDLLTAGVRASLLHRIDNGVDLDAHRPIDDEDERAELRRTCGLPNGPLVVFVGQWKERKGVAEALTAFEHVARARPATRFLVIGDGPLAAAVESAASRCPAIVALGPRDDVRDLLRAADVFVLPSRAEAFSNAALEAMACGLPLVVSRSVLPSRVGLDASTGAVVDVEPRAIAAALIALVDDPGARRACGRAARGRAESFGIARIARDHVSLYEELLRARRNRA